MKKLSAFIIAMLALILFANAQDSKNEFYGMWTLDIGDKGVGWLNVHDDNGFLDAELLWRWGSVVPVANVYFKDNKKLVVTRIQGVKRELEGGKERSHVITTTFEMERIGDKLRGTMYEPSKDGMSVEETTFKGWKLPDPGPKPDMSSVKYGEPIKLFNGKDLTGWKLINPNLVNGFKVVDGIMVNDPVQKEGERISYGNIRTVKEFEDFNLKLEVNVPEHSNSGIYLRGLYEIQVFDSYGKELDSHNMGGLYSRITPSMAAEKPGGEWQELNITLYKRHLTVKLNGINIIDNKPVYGPTGGAISADVTKPGPIYLQGDHGKVSYKNIVLTPINN